MRPPIFKFPEVIILLVASIAVVTFERVSVCGEVAPKLVTFDKLSSNDGEISDVT
jgi:hypothetical protein